MRLDPDDIERIADAVARRLTDSPVAEPGLLIDAATVARRLGVRRSWVYAHADQLGAIRLGDGRGRLRFDPARLPDRPAATPARAEEQTRRCRPGRRRRGRPRQASAKASVRLLPYLVESRHTIEVAGRRANAPGPTPGG